MSHSLCRWLPQISADNRQLLHSRNPWVCCIAGSVGGMIWWGQTLPNLTPSAPPGPSSLSSALVLLPHPAPHPISTPLCAAAGLPPCLLSCLPWPGPSPGQHQPSHTFASMSAKEHTQKHLQALVPSTTVTPSARRNNSKALLLRTCSRRLQCPCYTLVCDLVTRLEQASTEQVPSENSASDS